MKLLSELKNKHHYIEYDYGYDYHCEEYGCDMVCRCGTIENLEIIEVNIMGIVEKISNGELFSSYCVDRILRHFKIWNTDYWTLDIQHYYYGEEIFGAEHDNESVIDEHLLECLTLPASEKIPYVLELEYGYLLDEAKNRAWTIETVKREDIQIGSEYHKAQSIEEYKPNAYDLPVCVVLKIDGELRIIDGYHRLNSNKQDEIDIIVGR
jgi:hypothetical protein